MAYKLPVVGGGGGGGEVAAVDPPHPISAVADKTTENRRKLTGRIVTPLAGILREIASLTAPQSPNRFAIIAL
jgi:hypothetical protein